MRGSDRRWYWRFLMVLGIALAIDLLVDDKLLFAGLMLIWIGAVLVQSAPTQEGPPPEVRCLRHPVRKAEATSVERLASYMALSAATDELVRIVAGRRMGHADADPDGVGYVTPAPHGIGEQPS